MTRIVARARMAAPPEDVWPLVTHHEGMVGWSALRSVTLRQEGAPDRDGLGAIRVMRAAPGVPPIEEQVVAWNPTDSYEYTLLRGAPIRNHLGRVELARVPGGTEVTWTVTFDPTVPGTGRVIGAALRRALQSMLDALARRLDRELDDLTPGDLAVPLPYFLLLYNPKQIRRNLLRMSAEGHIDEVPNLWQVFMGVLYMWHRLAFRPETIGVATDEPVRGTWRARLLERKAFRLPFLLRERAITPLDFTGFGSTPDRIIAHLMGAYHPGENFVYDLQALSAHPGKLEELHERTLSLLEGNDPRAEWLRDLTVYEGYHERLRAAVERGLRGDFSVAGQTSADTTVPAFVAWCAAQPSTPIEAFAAWRRGELSFSPEASTP